MKLGSELSTAAKLCPMLAWTLAPPCRLSTVGPESPGGNSSLAAGGGESFIDLVAELESWQNLQRLRAVEGWIELGLLGEAQSELAELGAEVRRSLEGLNLQWTLFAEGQQWDAAFAVAQQSVELHSEDEAGWIHRAYAARRRANGGLSLARELLMPAVALFPRSTTIPYNLACYAAQLDEPSTAWMWLEAAAATSEWDVIRAMAFRDPDLESMWPRIREAP